MLQHIDGDNRLTLDQDTPLEYGESAYCSEPESIIEPGKDPPALNLGYKTATRLERPFRSLTVSDTEVQARSGGSGGGGGDLQPDLSRRPVRGHTADNPSQLDQLGCADQVNILISIRSHNTAPNYNAGAAGDLRLLSTRLKIADPRVVTTVLTDCSDVNEWLPDPNANVKVVPPSATNLQAAILSGAVTLKPGGKCVIWFGGFGSLRNTKDGAPCQVLLMADPQDVITGPELRGWLMAFHFTTTVQVCIDACHSGRFLGLPYSFNAKGVLVKVTQQPEPIGGPRIISVAACHPTELAFMVRSDKDIAYGGLTWYLLLIEQKSGCLLLKDIERLITPYFSDPDGKRIQHPQVEISYEGTDATLSLTVHSKPSPGTIPPR
ncbi:hypothetical protein FRB94_005546 [Tulasnella sp. JGI-2019a]|nr:hypothetical protein FRB93_006029 [Tulasnella sp. JGI-2019a]KAG9012610.1 hypothetical protein FRB94_005546 [Tulasnella sp. JGI-2019a]